MKKAFAVLLGILTPFLALTAETNRPVTDVTVTNLVRDTDYVMVVSGTNVRLAPVSALFSNRTSRGLLTATNPVADAAPIRLHGDTAQNNGILPIDFFYNGTLEYQLRSSITLGVSGFALVDRDGNVPWLFDKTSGWLNLHSPSLPDLPTNSFLYTGAGGLIKAASGVAFSSGGTLIVSNFTGTLTSIASNASTAQIDFTYGTTHYECTNLANALTLNLTNVSGLPGPRDVWIYIRTDGTARNVTVSTNGITTGLRVSWGLNSATNGATSVTATNRLRINLARVLGGELHAAYEHGQ